MLDRLRRLPPRTLGFASLAAVVLLFLALLGVHSLARLAIAAELRHAAASRGLRASWRRLEMRGFEVRLRDLAFVRVENADTLFRAGRLAIALDPWSLLAFSPEPASVTLEDAHLSVAPGGDNGAADVEVDLLRDRALRDRQPAAERVRRAADAVARVALAPARRLPELHLRDVSAESRPTDESAGVRLSVASLDLTHRNGGAHLAGSGTLGLEHPMPFELTLDYARDDRLAGTLWFGVADTVRRATDTLSVRVDGRLEQDRHRGIVRLAPDTRIWIGNLPLLVGGTLERRGPRVTLALAADGLTARRIERSIPAPLLGPLTQLAVAGSFDYRLALDLDVARPDSVAFRADVIPHALGLEAEGTTLPILGLDEPFVATIHLPHDRYAMRDLSAANPMFRPLEAIDSTLVHAVVTNEDGGFFHHRGFNLEAMRGALAENLRAGGYRRGAGTITMQLVRNLYLGHQRTLSRKAQEIVLAWVLEHLTGVSKQRVLEIYMNIIEWGPGVHGAAEATQYYFGTDPAHLTTAQALFLSTLLPAPNKWRGKFDRDGAVRVGTRQQMRFIARAMAARGWLAPEAVPEVESLSVEITGPARDELTGTALRGAVAPEAPRPN